MKLIFIVTFSIIFLGTSFFALYKTSQKDDLKSVNDEQVVSPKQKKYFPPVPVLKNGASSVPDFTAQSVYVVDVDSGVSVFEKNPDVNLLPASTTKIITALVALDYYKLGDIIKVGQMNVQGQKMGLVPGEEIAVEDLLSGLLIYSANDAAEALALTYPGGREAFVDAMNKKAKDLHLENSNYTNPSGLDGLGLTTTARDLARESVVAMKIPFFKLVVGTKEKTVTSVDGVYKHKLTNINELVGEVPGVLGVKTGWTENAKENLVSYVERDGHEVVFVVLKSDDRFGETRTLIDWVFENYDWKEVSF